MSTEDITLSKKKLDHILLNYPQQARKIIERKFPRIVDIEWMRSILIDYLVNNKEPLLTKTLDNVTAVSIDLVGSVRMQEIVSDKTGDNEIIPVIVNKVTNFYSEPFLKLEKYFTPIQKPSIRGDGGFFIFKGDEEALEKAISASLEAGRRVNHANQDYRLLKKILKTNDLKKYDFSRAELNSLKLQLRVGIKTDQAIQSILNLHPEDLNNIYEPDYISNAYNTVFGNAPNTAARLEVAGKELIINHPELRSLPVIITVTPKNLKSLEEKLGVRFKTTASETISLPDKNWSSEVNLVTGYKASPEIKYRTRTKKITELEQSLLNDLSVLQSGVEYWNEKGQKFNIKKDYGIEFFLLDEIFSLETSQRELDGLIQKGAVGIQNAEFGKRIVVAPKYQEKSLRQIGKEIDKKHKWASDIYEAVLDRNENAEQGTEQEQFFKYKLLARQGFHLGHYDAYKAGEIIREAANRAMSDKLYDLAGIYVQEAITMGGKGYKELLKQITSNINLSITLAQRLKDKGLIREADIERKNMINYLNLTITGLGIGRSMTSLIGSLDERLEALGQVDIYEDIRFFEEIIDQYKQLLVPIEALRDTELESDLYKAIKVVLSIPAIIYHKLGGSEKLSTDERRAYLYRALDSILAYEDFCLKDILTNRKTDKTLTDYINAISHSVKLADSITDLEKDSLDENGFVEDFSGKDVATIATELGVNEETAHIAAMSLEKKLIFGKRKSCKYASIARKNGYDSYLQRAYFNTAYFCIKLGEPDRAEKYLLLSEHILNTKEFSAEHRSTMERNISNLRKYIYNSKQAD